MAEIERDVEAFNKNMAEIESDQCQHFQPDRDWEESKDWDDLI
jgi:hypothetical protein